MSRRSARKNAFFLLFQMDFNEAAEFEQVKAVIDDYMDYYNNERYQWELAKLSPNEFYQFYMTGVYPIDIPNPPEVPTGKKKTDEE